MTNRQVAFKQAKANHNLKGVLPDDFITEWTYTDLHPPGTLSKDEGWQFQAEADFLPTWNRNTLCLEAHKQERQKVALERASLAREKAKGQLEATAKARAELAGSSKASANLSDATPATPKHNK